MTFTKTPPSVSGFYAWRPTPSDDIELVDVYFGEHETSSLFFYAYGYKYVIDLDCGEWCRLVPASELTDAWCEGRASVFASNLEETKWNNSRAKRVAEGKE